MIEDIKVLKLTRRQRTLTMHALHESIFPINDRIRNPELLEEFESVEQLEANVAIICEVIKMLIDLA